MKRDKKRSFAVLIMLALVLAACGSTTQDVSASSTTVTPNTLTQMPQMTPSSTSDQPSSWAAEAVETAMTLELMPETVRGSYQAPTTRAEFTAFAVALYETATGRVITERAAFYDTNDINVQKMGGLGVVAGVGNGNFAPDQTLTREQAAVMLVRLANVLGHPLPIVPATFSDSYQVSGWALESVGQVQAAGIMGGTGNNMFSPLGLYTREQSIITILRLYEILETEEPPATTHPTEPRREFNMNDLNVQIRPIFATARTMEELMASEEQRLTVINGGWRSAAETRATMHDDHPDRLVDGMTMYEFQLRPIFEWVNNYLAANDIDISSMTDYEKTTVIRRIIEEGRLEEFIGLWRPNFRFTRGDCVPRSQAVSFLMLTMDFELFRTIGTTVGGVAHATNAYWDSTTNTVRFIDADLGFGVWNLFVDEIATRNFILD